MSDKIDKRITEQSSLYEHLEKMSVDELTAHINAENKKVALAIEQALPAINQLISAIEGQLKKGGRLFYAGCGTGGRLATLDTIEVQNTYGIDGSQIQAIFPGGIGCLTQTRESREDDLENGWHQLCDKHISEQDFVLGSGLGSLVDKMTDKTVIPYADIPHFPRSTVAGHAGNLVVGTLAGQTVAALQGRFHYYEGFSMKEVTYPVYVMKLLGVKTLVVTNACGGIDRSLVPGDLMLLTDHINMLGTNSLIGPNDERFGVRFPDMTEAYSLRLRELAKTVAAELDIPCKEGVYAIFSGPCYETAAEIRAYRALGADAIGMSTVPETIAANYLGMEVLGIACITNMATGIAERKHSHEEVLAVADRASAHLCRLVERVIEKL